MKSDLSAETSLTLTGLFETMTNDQYHRGPGYSASDLIGMADGFDIWKWKKTQPREPSDAMELGTATHLLLEACIKNDMRIFHDSIAVMPTKGDGVLTTEKDYQAKCKELGIPVKGTKSEMLARILEKAPLTVFWEEILEHFKAGSAGKVVISPEDNDLAHRMIDAVMKEPEVVGYFQGGVSEPSIFVADRETGLLLKTRPDYLRPADGLSINFKTMRSDVTFERQAAILAYDWQSSFYMEVLEQHFNRHFDEIHVSVTKAKEGPCRVHVHTIDDEDLQFAKAQWRALLARIPACQESGIWPAPPAILQSVRIPNFARKVCPYV